MTDEHDDDALLDRLGSLPGTDVDPKLRESVRRAAHRALHRERALAKRPIERRLRRAYDRALEPLILAVVVLAYISWAVAEVQTILHP